MVANARYSSSALDWRINCYRRRVGTCSIYLHIILKMTDHKPVNKKPDGNITLAIVVGFIGLSLIFDIPVLIYIALAIGFISLLSTTIQGKIIFVWEKIAKVIGTINSYLLLSIIFFIFLTPIALLMKLLNNKDSLRLKKPTDSNFFVRDFKFKKEDLSNIW